MGFFSKGSDSGAGRRTSARPGDAQANEMRVRARRRLIGALALVVAAVVVVPMLIDTEPPPGGPVTPIVVPAIPPLPDQDLANLASNTPGVAPNSITIEQLPVPEAPNEGTDTATDVSGAAAANATAPAKSSAAQPGTPDARDTSTSGQVAAKPESPAKPEPAPPKPPASKPADTRTDDGAVALALLEGRQPASKPAPVQSGSFVLQIAAYTTEQDAVARRNKLFEAGVTNAFVQSATAGGKPTYRLRVGPFPSKEAAQAAQTRLRALGYDNGFISSK